PRTPIGPVIGLELLLIFEDLLVQCRKAFNLRLCLADRKVLFVGGRRLQFVWRHQKSTTTQPSTGVHHEIANLAVIRIENYIVNFAELLVSWAVHRRSADVVDVSIETVVS